MNRSIFISLLGASIFANFVVAEEKKEQLPTMLDLTSQAFTQIAEKAIPATVSIKVEIAQSNQLYLDPQDFFRQFFHDPFSSPQQQHSPQPRMAGGSGFLISSDGYIVTNQHVIQDATKITVALHDQREYEAKLIGSDARSDLALLKIEEKELPFLLFGNSDQLKIGEIAIAIGSPFGYSATFTMGVISGKDRHNEGLIQTDAAINPGNSGGPLLNIQGEVIGINRMIYTQSGGYMGIGFSIPSNQAQTVVGQIRECGSFKRGYLGVMLQPIDQNFAEAFQLNNADGALVADVVKGSQAAKAGLEPGDIILKYNDKIVKNVDKLRNEIGMMAPGTTLDLIVLRDSQEIEIKATLGASDAQTTSAELLQKIGLEVENITPEISEKMGLRQNIEGVVITNVKAGSNAFLAGLRKGLVITGVKKNNQQKMVHNTLELEESLKEMSDGKYLTLIIRQNNFQRYVTFKI